jgi:hypothetical protein
MNQQPVLLVLAAGIGSRYGGLKQIDPVGPHGEIIIDYSVYDALRAGFRKVVFVIRRDIEQDFRTAIGSRFEDKMDVEYVFQELDQLPDGYTLPTDRRKPWGTAHAILSARAAIREPFAVINADDFYGARGCRALYEFLSADRPDDVLEWALVGFVLRNTLSEHGHVARGVCRCSADHSLEKVTEHLKIKPFEDGARDEETGYQFTGNEYVSMNMWGFTPGLFNVLATNFEAFLANSINTPKAEFLIPSVVDDCIQAGTASVTVLPTSDSWFGITYAEDKPAVKKSIAGLVERGDYPSPLWGCPC